jgi:hypothetical protein
MIQLCPVTMSGSKGPKGPTDALMGLSVSEARLLLLGLVCEDGGKVNNPTTNSHGSRTRLTIQ